MTALPICLVVAIGVGATTTSFLGRSVVEQNRVLQEATVERASWRAIGEIEIAKNIIQAATYTAGRNDMITTALAANPPLVPGTSVLIESTGTGRWYRLSTTTDFGGSVGAATCMIRDGLSYAAYNYYVESHNLGVSGKPKGRIHANQALEFYFANGVYDGYVSAGKGFKYLSGATEANTKFLRGADPAALQKNLLSKISFPALKSAAAWTAPVGLVGEVAFQGANVRIRLYAKDSVIQVPTQKTRSVIIGYETKTVTKTSYRYEWQWVNTKKSRSVWVENNGSSAGGGTDVGGGATGYWATEYYWELVWTKVAIPNGTYTVEEQSPIYGTETYTAYVNQTVAGALVQTIVRANTGILYFPDTVRAISGTVNGKVTVVSESTVKITGSLQYVDSSNRTAYLNGTNTAAGDYVANPAFTRNHALGIIAQGDITYGRSAATALEINGALVSTTGTVAMEGIVLAADGTPSLSGSASIKNSLRRFGSIMCAKRPVATLLNNTLAVSHGFKAGTSVYDVGSLNDPPPGFPNEDVLTFLETVRVDSGGWRAPGQITAEAGVTALPTLRDFDAMRDATKEVQRDWGVTDLKSSYRCSPSGAGTGGTGGGAVRQP